MVNLYSWPSYAYIVQRQESRLYEGFIPVTTSLQSVFTLPGYLEVSIAGITIPRSVTIYGNVSETFNFNPGDRSVAGTTLFSRVDVISSSIGQTSGGLGIILVDSSGAPLPLWRTVETRRGVFSKQLNPRIWGNFGEIKAYDAVLLKTKGVEIDVHDLVYVAGLTYSVVQSQQLRDLGGDAFFKVDLKLLGREAESN